MMYLQVIISSWLKLSRASSILFGEEGEDEPETLCDEVPVPVDAPPDDTEPPDGKV